MHTFHKKRNADTNRNNVRVGRYQTSAAAVIAAAAATNIAGAPADRVSSPSGLEVFVADPRSAPLFVVIATSEYVLRALNAH